MPTFTSPAHSLKLLSAFLALLSTSALKSQSDLKYKKLSDSVFIVNDKILAPKILFSLPGPSKNEKEFRDSVDLIAAFLNKHPKLKIEIGAHTDTKAKPDFSIKLAEYRAQEVRDYLVKEKDISSSRIKMAAYGQSQVVVSDKTIKLEKNLNEKERLHEINRRTELRIISTGSEDDKVTFCYTDVVNKAGLWHISNYNHPAQANPTAFTEHNKNLVDSICNFLKKNPGVNITIETHTRTLGKKELFMKEAEIVNKNLSEELKARGIPETQYSFINKGDEEPLYTKDYLNKFSDAAKKNTLNNLNYRFRLIVSKV